MENAKIENLKCDILGDFQTLCRLIITLLEVLTKLYIEWKSKTEKPRISRNFGGLTKCSEYQAPSSFCPAMPVMFAILMVVPDGCLSHYLSPSSSQFQCHFHLHFTSITNPLLLSSSKLNWNLSLLSDWQTAHEVVYRGGTLPFSPFLMCPTKYGSLMT